MWVLRDFNVKFKHLTPEAYLDQSLEHEKVISLEGQSRNELRTFLKSSFPSLECF